MMREATKAEYLNVSSYPHAVKRLSSAGRTQDVQWWLGGVIIAQMLIVFTRMNSRRISSVQYAVDPELIGAARYE